MRLDKYLTEKVDVFETIKKLLLRDCSQFIKEAKNTDRFLYRGTQKSIKNIKAFTPREDRYPKDTPKEIHDILDKIFKQKFGWKARSEGVFVTPLHNDAAFYGKAHLFFPFDGYKFIWSYEIEDLYTELGGDDLKDELYMSQERGGKRDPYYGGKIKTEDEFLASVERIFRQTIKSYISSDLINAINSGHEIMFKCKKYYLVNYNWKASIINNIFNQL